MFYRDARNVGKMAESQESLDPLPLRRSLWRESTAASGSSGQSSPHRGPRSQTLELIGEYESLMNKRKPGKIPLVIPDL
jgi:hypothetical protein